MTNIVKYTPTAPVSSAGTLRSLMEQQSAGFLELLPKHVTPARLIKTLMVAVNRTPKLLQCTQSSILESVTRAAELGLDLSGTMGEAYLVPFNNKVGDQWVSQAQLIPGYRGLAKLARQTGEVSRLDANVVHENDKFIYELGVDFKLKHRPCITGDAGSVIGAYALCQFKDGTFQADFMTTAEIEKIRQISKGKNQGPWRVHWNEMAKKTVFRRLVKWLPLSGEKWEGAIEQDNAGTIEPRQVQATVLPDLPAEPAMVIAAPVDDAAPVDQPTPAADEPAKLRGTTNDDGKWFGQEADKVTGEITWVDTSGIGYDADKHGWSAANDSPAYTKAGLFRAKRGSSAQPVDIDTSAIDSATTADELNTAWMEFDQNTRTGNVIMTAYNAAEARINAAQATTEESNQ